MANRLIDSIVKMREKEAIETAMTLLESGEDPLKILHCCKEAMDRVGRHFEKGNYVLPELIMSGEIIKEISEMLKPELKGPIETTRFGKIVIGTVEGDIHDIGKDIVVFMLDANGFEVDDLGIDVAPRNFVEAILDFQPEVVGLSGFLTLAFDSMKATVDAIKKAGLRDQVKIMIGGGQIDDHVRIHTGADAYGRSAIDAVKISKQWIGRSANEGM